MKKRMYIQRSCSSQCCSEERFADFRLADDEEDEDEDEQKLKDTSAQRGKPCRGEARLYLKECISECE
jgi:hypothetical protein